MRVIDFGQQSPLRSQSVWHALTRAVRAGDEPILSFGWTRQPYVCLGYHRDLAEVDTEHCATEGIPVYRRMVGGGPVYLDSDQMFFQVIMPARNVPARRTTALAELLAPAAATLRDVGVAAELDRFGEISVGSAKVCGHAAAQLGEGVVVVGNLISDFNHERAARVLRMTADARRMVLSLMRRYVQPTPGDVLAWKTAIVRRYAEYFGSGPVPDRMTADERDQLGRMDSVMARSEFIAGQSRPTTSVRTIKVRAGVWVHEWRDGTDRLILAVADGTVQTAWGSCTRPRPEELIGRSLADARGQLDDNRGTAALASALRAANTEVAAA